MNNGIHRSCCCPVCDCGEDCNGVWGLPNEDKAFQCCWSVGDRVLYRHTWGGSYTVRSGGIVPSIGCHDSSYNCGIVKYVGGSDIEVEYVCIGARGNYHDPIIDPRLPEFINGKSWEGEPVPSPTGDGYNVSPIVYNISPNQSYNDPPTKTDYQQLKTLEGEYVINNAHVPGCANGWNYRYYDKYDGFEVVETINGLEYTYSWEPKLKNTDDIEISLKETFCGTIADCLEPFNKNVNVCKEGDICGEDDIILPESCWVKNTDGDFERIKCDPNSPCSCYGIDEQGNVFGKNEYKLFQHATIFALDLTNPNIQYCSQNGYWIEQEIEKKWAKYELSPYLILFNRPMIEWQCDCKDTDDEYILKDQVGPGKKREVYGGFSWYGWNGNCSCSGDNCCASNFKSLAPCVQECLSLENNYAGGNGLVPCASVITDGQPEGPYWASFREVSTLGGYSTADFFNCQNCTEAVASCSGFKSYCVIRKTNMPKCPGECQSFYGIMEDPSNCNLIKENEDIKVDALKFACNYGCAEPRNCASENYTPFCQTFSPKDSGLLIFPDAYIRTECKTYTTHTLTITPVEEDSRRCNWYVWDGIDNNGNLKEYRCCGTAGRANGKDIGETVNITNPYGNIGFSWTEGVGWVSTCENLGKECGGGYYQGPTIDEPEARCSGPNQACCCPTCKCTQGNFTPDIICNEGNNCGSVQCSGTTSWLSYDKIASGDYPCYLATTQRACCQLPENFACDCEWWPNSIPKSYEPKYWREEQIPNLDEYWNLQINVSNMPVIVGCICTPPSCGCEGPGNYTENSGTKCNLDNYTVESPRKNCSSGCFDYIADTWSCNYTPEILAGTQAFCPPSDPCPDECPGKICNDNTECANFCCGSCIDDATGFPIAVGINGCICQKCEEYCPSGSTWVPC